MVVHKTFIQTPKGGLEFISKSTVIICSPNHGKVKASKYWKDVTCENCKEKPNGHRQGYIVVKSHRVL
jgi:hypothetical protein